MTTDRTGGFVVGDAALSALVEPMESEDIRLTNKGGIEVADSSSAHMLKVRSLAAGQVHRVVAAAIEDGMHVSKDARIAFQKVATISILYLSCLAEDERLRDSRKRANLSSNDVKSAIKAAGMGHLIPLLNTGHVKRARSEDRTML